MMRLIRALLGALGGVGVLISNCDPGAGAVGVRAAQAAEASGQRSERGAVTERAAKEPTPNASDCLTFQNDVQLFADLRRSLRRQRGKADVEHER